VGVRKYFESYDHFFDGKVGWLLTEARGGRGYPWVGKVCFERERRGRGIETEVYVLVFRNPGGG